jgi:hypothetical protein
MNGLPKGTEVKKLNLKEWELNISDGNIECGACHRTIPSGRPALLHRTVNTVNGELVIAEKTECARLCSDPLPRIEPSAPAGLERRRARLPDVRPEWDDLPDEALPEHQERFPIYNIDGERIAAGYRSIVTLNDDIHFLECAESQVVQTMFKEMPGESDRYGSWIHMQTPSGFYARRYVESNGDFVSGHWYFRLNLVKPGRAQAHSA